MPSIENLQEAEGKTEQKLEKIEIAEDQKTNLNCDKINDSKKYQNRVLLLANAGNDVHD